MKFEIKRLPKWHKATDKEKLTLIKKSIDSDGWLTVSMFYVMTGGIITSMMMQIMIFTGNKQILKDFMWFWKIFIVMIIISFIFAIYHSLFEIRRD